VLSLIRHGDGLSFSYSAVFGPTAHLCDGAGVAGLVSEGRYEYTDDEGTVAILVEPEQVRMEVVSGVASFCGAGWSGDQFTHDGYSPPVSCSVAVERTHFYVVDPVAPERRRAYVIQGDTVETVPVRHEGGEGWLLARFVGPTATTAGLLASSDLQCREEPFQR
jgi:hypothetical protein